MKISDIIAEAQPAKGPDSYYQTLINKGESEVVARAKTLYKPGDDIEAVVNLARAQINQQKNQTSNISRKQPVDKKSADKSTKPEKTTRASRFATAGSDAVSQGTGFISKAWQRGGRWSKALGIPKPKKD